MLQKIASLTLLALTAFYSVSASAQPGPPRSPDSRGPQFQGQHGPQHRGPQHRGPQSHGQHGSQYRGPQSQGKHASPSRPPQFSGQSSSRAPQSKGSWQGKPQSAHGSPKAKTSVQSHAQAYINKIKKGVADGQMSREDAVAKIQAIQKRLKSSQAQPSKSQSPQRKPHSPSGTQQKSTGQQVVQGYVQRVQKLVAAGELSREEAAAKIQAFIKKTRSQHGKPQTDRAPQRGPQPQGRPPQSRPDQRPAGAPSADKRAEAARIMEMTKRAVESGQMTREQAMERLNAWRQRVTGKAPQRGPQTQSRPAVPATKAIPVRPAERKPQSAPAAKPRSEAIPATKIQPSRIFQLPPEKKEQ